MEEINAKIAVLQIYIHIRRERQVQIAPPVMRWIYFCCTGLSNMLRYGLINTTFKLLYNGNR